MAVYILRRSIQAIPILIGISIIVFAIVYLAPGDPLARFRTPRVPPELIEALARSYGFDRPLHERYLSWVGTFVQLWRPEAWGYSVLSGDPVLTKIMARVPATLLLMGTTLLVTIIIAIPIGMLAALRQYSWTDKIITTLATVGYAMPSFLLGTYVLYFGSIVLPQLTNGQLSFPSYGMDSPGRRGDPLDILWHMVLPVTTLSIISIAAWSRYMRTSMLDVLHQDYIRTAKAKGLPRRSVIYRHALRNALIPIVTLLGLSIPTLIAGAAITETIFSWPGLGSMFIEAVGNRDFPVVLALTMMGGFAVVLGNLLADVLYGVVDPRIRY
jgi:peptide/nickel transport system permease protein